MGQKYSINSTGNIVAERDIYSLGGFIPKGRVGGKVASESQLSQDGDCWLAAGDISNRPDVRIKDNAYVGNFMYATGVHTDGITEFSGDTLIPGVIIVRNPIADPVNSFFVRNSLIGVSMDALCGPAATTTAFPFEQGQYNHDVSKGTLFTSAEIKIAASNICRTTATLRLGKDTYLYIPTGYNCRVLWGYYDASNQLAYSGESFAVSQALTKLSHPVYNVAMLHIAKSNGTAMTPTDLLSTGAKILGHISSSVMIDIRPESVSGEYVINNSSFIMNTNNFGLNTTQLRFLAGGLHDTNMYTKTDRGDYKPFGTFHNVERLEYTKVLGDAYRTHKNRDKSISAYDCPLLRVDEDTYNATMIETGDLILRRCIVPKAAFRNDVINGNTYEDIDFSYANEDLLTNVSGYTNFLSSHREGLYRLDLSGGFTNGLVSRKGNLATSGRLYPNIEYIPLDGNLIEQGTYTAAIGQFYEDGKSGVVNTRLRTGKPVSTRGLNFPGMPSGYVLTAAHYLDEGFKFANSVANPTSIDTTYPYVVFVITKTDQTEVALAVGFIALNVSLSVIDYSKVPEITGSSHVGSGVTVRGDVKLIGDPYVNRVLDVNWFMRGRTAGTPSEGWESIVSEDKTGTRMITPKALPVGDNGFTLSCNPGYWINLYLYGDDGSYVGNTDWVQSVSRTPESKARYAGILFKKAATAADDGDLVTEADIQLANVKYVRAFKKLRYITSDNQYDRKSPEDILIGPDYWRIAAISTGAAYIGRIYDSLIQSSSVWAITKRPLNMGLSWTVSSGNPAPYSFVSSSWDALTKLLGLGVKDNAALTGLELKKASGETIILSDVTSARIIVEFIPCPRIIVPYGASGISVNGMKIRMYDNAVLSKNINTPEKLVLRGNAVLSTLPSGCVCGWGGGDAIMKE